MRLITGLFGLALCFPAAAQWSGWDYTNDREIKPWAEMQAQIPQYPGESGLVAFDVGASATHRFYVAPSSLSIGDDGVVRYIVAIRTAGGANNITFEGMRCETREYKTYAVAQRDGSWARARDPQWRRIEYQPVNAYHAVLYADFFCRNKLPPKSVKDIVQELKYPSRPAIAG